MSDLIVVGYDNIYKADEVLLELRKLEKEHLIALDDAVVVIKDNEGKVKVKQSYDLTTQGAVSGGIWGALFGTIFLGPIGGLVTGAVSAGVGALSGSAIDVGIDDDFINQLGETIQNGTSALFILVREYTPDRVLEDIRPYGGRILRTNLSKEAEANLRTMLQEQEKTTTPTNTQE